MLDTLTMFGFGPEGWGPTMLRAAANTVAVAAAGFALGGGLGILVAWAKIAGNAPLRWLATAYTTVLRGIPDLLVIYLFYFGSGLLLTPIANMFGVDGFVSLPGFLAGMGAIGVVSGAYHAEVIRGAFHSVRAGELEAATAMGMPRLLKFRRITLPLVTRHALPGLGNVWQMVLKESALISVTGLVEIMRQAQIGSSFTRQPFTFYFAAGVLFLTITFVSGLIFSRLENRYSRGKA